MASAESSCFLYPNEAKWVSGISCKKSKKKKHRNFSLTLSLQQSKHQLPNQRQTMVLMMCVKPWEDKRDRRLCIHKGWPQSRKKAGYSIHKGIIVRKSMKRLEQKKPGQKLEGSTDMERKFQKYGCIIWEQEGLAHRNQMNRATCTFLEGLGAYYQTKWFLFIVFYMLLYLHTI